MMARIAWMIGAATLMTAAVATSSWAGDDGKALFVSLKCTTCHAVTAAGVEAKTAKPMGGDLSGIGAKHDAQWVQDLLAGTVKSDGGKKHAKFKGTPQEAKTLADWLAAQK
jgi:cytochrome c553